MDLVSLSLRAAATHSAVAPALIFAAGAISSVGPCVAPRFIAIAGIAASAEKSAARRLVFAFCGGLTVAYAAFGAAATLLAGALQHSGTIYAALAVALAAAGAVTLWREEGQCTRAGVQRNASFGGVFLLGASSALVLSPCCSPIVAAVVAYGAEAGDPVYAAAMLAIFSLGHMLPLIAAAAGATKCVALLSRLTVARAGAVLSGSLMLGLAAYYAVLA